MTTGLVGQHQLAPFASPQPGQPLDATVVLGNDNSTVNTYDAHDSDSTIHFQSSALADRPPASTLGQKWLTTDTGARYIYYDNGSAWVEVDYFRDTGGTIVGDVTVTGNVSINGTLGVTGQVTLSATGSVIQRFGTTTAACYQEWRNTSGYLQMGVERSTGGGIITGSTGYAGVLTTVGTVLQLGGNQLLALTLTGAAAQFASTLGVTGIATFTAQPVMSSLTASKPVFTDASKGLVSTGTLGTDQGGTNLTTYTTGDILYASATNVLSKLAIGTTGQHLIVSGGVPAWSTDSALGTVTSVSFTGGLISVATATTTPALTVAGTSGGVVYFSSASTWASSAALTASAIVLGGGAGAAPATTTTGTGVVTALGVNVGTAGAFVVNGGALGTPSSGAVAASLITAGTFGAGAYTFPSSLAITGAFTGATTGAFSSTLAVTGLASFNGAAVASTGTAAVQSLSIDNTGDDKPMIAFRRGGTVRNYLRLNTDNDFRLLNSDLATGSGLTMGALTATTGAFSTSAAIPITGVRTDAAGVLAVLEVKRSATTIGYIGMDASDNFALISGAGAVVGLKMSSAGLLTIPGAATFSSTVTSTVSAGLIVQPATTTAQALFTAVNTGGTLYIGLDNSAGNYLGTGGVYGTAIYRPASTTFAISRTSNVDLLISATGTITAAGVYSTTVGATNRDVYVDSTGLIGYVSSIRASKTNITPLTDTAWLDALTPVAFNYRKKDEDGAYTDEANTPLEYGLIAEDVEGINPELVFYDETEDGLALRGVSYNKLMIPLLQRVQALTARNDALTARVAALEGV